MARIGGQRHHVDVNGPYLKVATQRCAAQPVATGRIVRYGCCAVAPVGEASDAHGVPRPPQLAPPRWSRRGARAVRLRRARSGPRGHSPRSGAPRHASCSSRSSGSWCSSRSDGLVPAVAMGIGARCTAMLTLPLTSTLLATLLLAADGLAVMPLVIVAVIVAHIATAHLTPAPAPAEQTPPVPAPAVTPPHVVPSR